MVQSNIKVFIRVRPSGRPSNGFSSKAEEGVLAFDLDRTQAGGELANNQKSGYKYKFDGILPMDITQDKVFDVVAKPVIEDVMQGINGTIFAYGQSGSGKTFTITGGSERYTDRGLIPRTIAHIFESFRQRPECKHSLYISYLEIYNDNGYDLLPRP